ncbi:hypothetical protein ACA910_000362 [Epithemia clementina (nom. ined.)]
MVMVIRKTNHQGFGHGRVLFLLSLGWGALDAGASGNIEAYRHVPSTFEVMFPNNDEGPIFYSSNTSLLSLSTPPEVYTAFDDASWAITSHNLSNHFLNYDRQAVYDSFIAECIKNSERCEEDNNMRIRMNVEQPASVVNYTTTGFKKIRAPEPLYRLLKEFWDANRDKAYVEMDEASPYHNSWSVPTTILLTEDSELTGGGQNLSAAIWNSARTVLEEWTGQKLSGSSVYGIRVYHNQSMLLPHVDRLPLVSSAIINVDQDVEEDWVLEVYGHDGKATNVTMKPGDMVLYESHSVIHGRPFPLNGRYYANVFVHFEPMGDIESLESLPEAGVLPPYLIAGSKWEEQFRKQFPRGWELLRNVEALAHGGDLYTLRYVAQRSPDTITDPDRQCAIMSAAIKSNHFDLVQFLIEEMNYDPILTCDFSLTILDVALYFFDPEETIPNYLENQGARSSFQLLLANDVTEAIRREERCSLVKTAFEHEDVDVLIFLIDRMGYDVNMSCAQWYTLLDDALLVFDEDDKFIDLLIDYGAFSYDEQIKIILRDEDLMQLQSAE